MTTPLRIAASTAALALALPAAADASGIALVPLAPQSVAASRQCSVRPASPATIAYAAPADLPAIAAEQHVTGRTAVLVDLDARGRLTESAVIEPSGNPWIDAAALRTARLSRYTAEVRDCATVAGVYAVIVDFTTSTPAP
ncbi:MAG TPA: energy transducer TonB [Candidatus Elarobacter sp.]|nr:energy transducer TonB [Candidatus Elarobacter sp.]